MHAPVVLKKRGEISVIRIRQDERALRKSTAQCYCKQQIVVINMPITITIEVRKVFDQLDTSLLKYFQIQIRLDTLNFTTNRKRMVAAEHRERVAKLEATLFRLLRHAERRAILNARKGKLWTRRDWQRVVAERTEAEVEDIYVVRRK